jgi:hypothetical protein
LALKKAGVFPDNEPIWLVGNLLDKQAAEDGFNRKVMLINNLDDLIQAVEKSVINGIPRASLLIMVSIPDSLKVSLEEFTKLVNALPEVNVYEVGRGSSHVVANPFVYGTLNVLIAEAKGMSRTQYITDMDPNDKQKQILLTLDQDLAIQKSKLSDSLKVLEELNNEKIVLQRKIDDLQAKLINNSDVKMEAYRDTISSLENTLSRLEEDLATERKKSKELSKKYAEATNTIIDHTYSISALKNKLAKADELANSYKLDLKAQNQLYIELQTRMSNLSKSQVDKEQYVILENEIARSKKRIQTLETELNNSIVKTREKDLDIKDLINELDRFHRGDLTQTVLGRTLILDKAELKNTDLIYIKIVNELPYFRLALSYLFDELQERYNNKAKLMILKNDDGLDSVIFNGLKIFGDLESIPRDVSMFRLHPNLSMFNGITKLEETTDCIVIVDYIQNNEYYLTTSARKTVMTMVRNYEMINNKLLGLQGSPLTLGFQSIYDLSYDPRIGSAGLPTTRHLYVKEKVGGWALALNIKGNNV